MMRSMFAHSFSFLAAEKSIYRSICIRNVRKKNIYLIYLSLSPNGSSLVPRQSVSDLAKDSFRFAHHHIARDADDQRCRAA